MKALKQKNRNRQMSIKIDEDSYDAITEAMREQHLSVVTRKLLMMWLESDNLQKKVRLSTVQSLHELKENNK